MRTKDKSVSLEQMSPAMWPMANRVDHVYREELGYELMITAGSELTVKHKKGSFHYPENTPDKFCRAIDCRTRSSKYTKTQLQGDKRIDFHNKIIAAAGENFQVIDEGDHFNIELDR